MAVVDVGRVGGPPLDVAPPTHHSDDSALRRVLPIEKAYDKSLILLLIIVMMVRLRLGLRYCVVNMRADICI